MQPPFSIQLPPRWQARAITSQAWPDPCEFKIPYATPHSTIIDIKENPIKIVSQSYVTNDFSFFLYSIEAAREVNIRWRIVRSYVFWAYQLVGDIVYKLQGSSNIAVFLEGSYCPGYATPGNHTLILRRGKFHFLHIAMKPGCFSKLVKGYHIFFPLLDLQSMENSKLNMLQYFPIDAEIKKCIKQLEKCNKTGNALKLSVLNILQDMTNIYERQVRETITRTGKTTAVIVQEVKEYIIAVVAKGPRQTIATIAALHYISEKTLAREFSRTFGISLKKFKVIERMKVARSMMEQGIPLAVIAGQLGYSTAYNLRREFYNHFRYWPDGTH